MTDDVPDRLRLSEDGSLIRDNGEPYVPDPRIAYANALTAEVGPEVWLRLGMNGSLRIDIDTDVQCHGPWEPYGPNGAGTDDTNEVMYAQSWVAYFVRSTIRQLIDKGYLIHPYFQELKPDE